MTGLVGARPPLGNLVSANRGCGVRIDDGAGDNVLSGNFIGTTASGNAPLGNWKDGVAIVDSDRNSLKGTTAVQNPFVYYNVVSGNLGNGLRITNSDYTVVHANFFGLGANNATRVPNGGDGMLVTGDSWQVDAGGEIPLGNVMSGNARYGIEVRDTASGLVSFNNFVGQTAFGGAAANALAGIRITSSNPRFNPADSATWNRIRTSLIGGNWGNGVEFLGNAYGAEITDTAVGTNYAINAPLPNLGNGIVVGGNASQIAIGGFQPSIEQGDGGFSVHVGSNKGFGIVFQESAHDNFVFNTRVGLGVGMTIDTAFKLPNLAGGIFVGPGTANITVGGVPDITKPLIRYADEIVGNYGNGLTVVMSPNFVLLGCTISGNTGSGLLLNGASGATGGGQHPGPQQGVRAVCHGIPGRHGGAVVDDLAECCERRAARGGPGHHPRGRLPGRGKPDLGEQGVGHPRLRLVQGLGPRRQPGHQQHHRQREHEGGDGDHETGPDAVRPSGKGLRFTRPVAVTR
jgi:hypothetical protein